MAMKVVALSGSPRPGSRTRKALDVAVAGAMKAGAEVTVVDFSDPQWQLPLFDGVQQQPGKPPPPDTPEVVTRFRKLILEADGLIIATPVFHDSVSGVLKNALDYLYIELADKVAGLLAVAGGRSGHGVAMEHLRAILRETGTWVLPRQVPVGQAATAFDAEGKLQDPETRTRLELLGAEVTAKAMKLRPAKKAG